MAQLEVLQCSGCGSPLSPGALLCEYCGNHNLVKSKRNPLKITSEIANEYISFYSKKAKKNPKDVDSLFAMGLLYLNLKNYELAERSLKDAIDRSPLDADVYYYYTLALLAGKNIKTMSAKNIERVEQYLGTAIQMEVKCKYLVLLAVIKEEYYIQNHLVFHGDSPKELFAQAQDYSPDELDEVTDHCTLCGANTLHNISLITGVATKEAADKTIETPAIDDTEKLTPEEVYVAYNLTAEQRRQFYDYRLKPLNPGYNSNLPEGTRLQIKSSYVAITIQRVWKLALNFLLVFILFSVLAMLGWGLAQTEQPLDNPSAEESALLKERSLGAKFTIKERQKLVTQLKQDSLQHAHDNKVFAASHIRFVSKINDKQQVEEIVWIKKSAGGVIWLIVIISPLVVWLVFTFVMYKSVHRRRLNAVLHNRRVWDDYYNAVNVYNTKPSDLQMALFIQKYLSGVIDTELAFHGKSEHELKGKTLFLNEFFDYKQDGPNYRDSAIEYKIVLLESDCVTVLCSDWHVYEDCAFNHTIESVSYSDIKEVKLAGNVLSFGGIIIEKPCEQAFIYQNDNPDDELTFSNTRTSDLRQFSVALRRLQTAYKNNKP